ncbi:phosphodiester glycosidase family protein [Cytobacillus spongiae]|uniref:phosphodiester glycosidase family protein n=1 Tax=Cytobacillus spongiae TaxID=2901381 RepID=UPI001F1CB50E|nr:phosphodiester glycosidase family protein [Cytobacillus spongiae]UII55635.1 phosphodiester glycosidase family protein [Cytobacillus spongiae]
MKKYFIAILIFFLIGIQIQPVNAAESVTKLTPGISLTNQSLSISNKKQSIHQIQINLQDPYTDIDYGISNPINKLTPVTSLAKMHTFEKHHVVGAINASFFHMDSGEVAYLLSSNNQIANLGALSSSSTDYMHTPAAFGKDRSGKGIIDRFQLQISITHHNQTYQLSSFNRQRNENESILYTQSFRYSHTRTNPTGMEIVVKGLNKNLDPGATFGEPVTGKVVSIRPYGQVTSAEIPKDGYVISAHGTAVDQVRNLKVGDPVTIQVGIDQKWKDAKFILASGPLLVQNGKSSMTIDSSSPRATSRAPRSAVAVDASGTKVFYVTVDGRQPGYSEGMTLKEFSNYLVGIGAYQALNLDGGGSTTMAARIPGNRYASLVNKPSDGKQRSVSAILQAISTAPYGQAATFEAKQAAEGKILVGGSVAFQLNNVLDSYNNLITLNNEMIEYEVIGGIGTVENHRFIAEKAGNGYVLVKSGLAKVKVPIAVVANPSKIEASQPSIYIGKGQSQKLSLKVYDSNGKLLIHDPQRITWKAEGNVGTVQPDGTFIASTIDANGSLTAQIGEKKLSIPVTVNNKPKLLDGFESLTKWSTDSVRARTTIGSVSDGSQKEGNSYLKLNYDFTGNKSGTTASYAVAKNRIPIEGKPLAIGLWAYGDGQNHWLRGRLYDAAGKEVTVSFTEEGALNWNGWKYVQATIPTNVQYPLSFERVYIAETVIAKQSKGTIYLDQLQAIYELPHKEAYFKTNSSTKTVESDKKWTVSFNTALSPTTVNDKAIYVQDVDGNRLQVKVGLHTDGKTAYIQSPVAGYEKGKAYQLIVTKAVRSLNGVAMRKDYAMPFIIK